jgi:hypothetical protein
MLVIRISRFLVAANASLVADVSNVRPDISINGVESQAGVIVPTSASGSARRFYDRTDPHHC